ncbi:hypothetical protein GCM10011351_28370 [Paraliobacillus quinghaiensis]|uniref:Uncharacterized protein n=1 Tax=Paraliobacillus quinghaiensis TaxID=470815 RepID=A0A917WY92_9BACI|nr:hypothetical protein [Paraliobacillus quinghaiensis]GGM40528.1 hypothetical protein GCM10011351_28370 [Paraliobacillus quinghaiensis]
MEFLRLEDESEYVFNNCILLIGRDKNSEYLCLMDKDKMSLPSLTYYTMYIKYNIEKRIKINPLNIVISDKNKKYKVKAFGQENEFSSFFALLDQDNIVQFTAVNLDADGYDSCYKYIEEITFNNFEKFTN